MRFADYDSNDVETASLLAYENPDYDDDRPTLAEAERDDEQD